MSDLVRNNRGALQLVTTSKKKAHAAPPVTNPVIRRGMLPAVAKRLAAAFTERPLTQAEVEERLSNLKEKIHSFGGEVDVRSVPIVNNYSQKRRSRREDAKAA